MKQTGLLKPLVTEKAARAQAANNVYSFIVDADMSKGSVVLAFRKAYNVKPVSVRIIRMEGKKVRYGKASGQEKSFKKAFVTVAKGTAIAVVDPTKPAVVAEATEKKEKKAKKSSKKANA